MRKIYLTPKEIFEKYPELKIKFNWTQSDIGLMMRNKLLSGYYSRNKRASMIEESSLLNLIKYVNSLLEDQILILQ
jgi:hypothetical protein